MGDEGGMRSRDREQVGVGRVQPGGMLGCTVAGTDP